MAKQTNGAMFKFEPTHRTRVWYVQAERTKIERVVKTVDGDVKASVGDYIVVYGNGVTTVLTQRLFESNFEPIKTEKEEDNE